MTIKNSHLVRSLGQLVCAASVLASALALADEPIDVTTGRAAPGTHEQNEQSGDPRGVPAMTVIDDFNRADGPIGGDWTVHAGTCSIVSNAARCDQTGLATNAAADGATTLSIDVSNEGNTGTKYAAIIQGYGGGTNNIFIKVQANSGTQFDSLGCYTGNNGSSFGLGFTSLNAAFTSATMTVTRTGNDVQIDFTNIDGGAQADQNYLCSGAPTPDGTGAGIAGYANLASMDNFSIAGAPAPAEVIPVPVNHPAAMIALVMLMLLTGWTIRYRL